MGVERVKPDYDGTGLRIGIVRSRFNAYAGEGLEAACLAELVRLGVSEDDITVVEVPGALEIPLALQTLADTGDFDALVALGAVIRGETAHFDIVSRESARGIMNVTLNCYVPVANGVLTTDDDEQTQARLAQKGLDCARCAIEMANLVMSYEVEDEQEDA